MALKTKVLDIEELRSMLDYNSETGDFHWKFRPECGKAWNSRFAGKKAGTTRPDKYVLIAIHSSATLAHRIAYCLFYNKQPMHIDHIDGNPSNNKIDNLRDVTPLENGRNNKLNSNNTSGYPGVFKYFRDNSKFLARIYVNGKTVALGLHNTKEEAIKAKKAAESFYGFHENHGRS